MRKHGFIRAHWRALIRLDGVRELIRDYACAMVAPLGCGATLPVSKRRSAAFAAAVWRLGKEG